MTERKTIKVEEPEYKGLDDLRAKGETFNNVISRLLELDRLVRSTLTSYIDKVAGR